MKPILVLLCILLSSCSSKKNDLTKVPQIVEDSKPSSDFPDWVYSPYSYCSEESHLCASGEGKNSQLADLAAQKGLASIFESKVQGQLYSLQKMDNTNSWQEVWTQASESVSEVLEASYIGKRFKKEGYFYSLAQLDKLKATQILEKKIKEKDDEIRKFDSMKSRMTLLLMKKLLMEREALVDRYVILWGKRLAPPISFEEVNSRLQKLKREKIGFEAKSDLPQWIKKSLAAYLNQFNYELAAGSTTKVLKLEYEKESLPIKVSGFEKLRTRVNFELVQAASAKGSIFFEETLSCRDESQCIEKMNQKLNDYIKNHFHQLNFD